MLTRTMRPMIMLACLLAVLSLGMSTPVAAQDGSLSQGFVDFEGGVDGLAIGTTIPGVRFTTSSGAPWLYGDVRTGQYNAPFPDDCPPFGGQCAYAVRGDIFAWAGAVPGTARIEFTLQTGTYFEALFSTGEQLRVEAFDAAGASLGSRSVSPNLRTGRMATVRIDQPGIASVRITGTENRWLMDNLRTDALIFSDIGIGLPQQERPPRAAQVTVVQRPSATGVLAPGSTLTLTVVATNRGKGGARNVEVTLPLDPARVSVANATFSREGAWVSRLVTNTLEIQTGPISPGEVVTATLRMLVLPNAPPDGALGERLSFTWSDAASGGTGRSNAFSAAVGRPLPALTLASEGAARRTFSAAVFAPFEPVGVWYNTPAGQAVAVGTLTADSDGRLSVTLDTAGLTPGAYTMVAYGHWTEFTVTTPFSLP